MARTKEIVIITVESFWLSGTFELSKTKALAFAKSLRKNHEFFLQRKNPATKRCHSWDLSEEKRILHVQFETVIKKSITKPKRKQSSSSLPTF